MYIDAHYHLEMIEKEGDISIQDVIENARTKIVRVIVANGVNPKTNRKVLGISERYDEVKACLGIYPVDALDMSENEINEELKFIEKNKDKIIGIGEVGMDFKEDLIRHNKQEKTFREFIELAKKLDKPIIVHSRKAEKECIEILEEFKAEKVMMHYFSGSLKLVERVVGNGWFLSIPTCVKYNKHFQKVVEKTPIENLLCETDSPYSHPEKKFPNEPANVTASYEMIAKIKGLNLAEVEKITEENYHNLFKSNK